MMKNDKPENISVYIHIPFCVRKCLYCDFLSGPASEASQKAYINALCEEIRSEAYKYEGFRVVSVFIGGGTPSVIDAEDIRRVLNTLRQSYRMAAECETTIEVNPGTATEDKLRIYRECGINRLSIGLQSAMNGELKALGRIHSYEDFLDTYEKAVKIGFSNINVDLMSAIPEQSLSSYRETLNRVLQLTPQPVHISAYSLIVEEGTPFYENTPKLPDEDTEREMYKITREILEEAGFHRYEISNYAKPGYECFHNKVYWTRGNYVGFGIGSASLVKNRRFHNITELESYVNHIKEYATEIQSLTMEEQMEEFMFLGLRMMKGVSEQEFYENYHQRFEQVFPGVIAKYVKLGLLAAEVIDGTDFLQVRLTLQGIDVSNTIMADFLLT